MRDRRVAVGNAYRIEDIVIPDHDAYAVKDPGLRRDIHAAFVTDGETAKDGFIFRKTKSVDRIVKRKHDFISDHLDTYALRRGSRHLRREVKSQRDTGQSSSDRKGDCLIRDQEIMLA